MELLDECAPPVDAATELAPEEEQVKSILSRVMQACRWTIYVVAIYVGIDAGLHMYDLHYGSPPVRVSAQTKDLTPQDIGAIPKGNIFNRHFTVTGSCNGRKIQARIYDHEEHGLAFDVDASTLVLTKNFEIGGATHNANSLISRVETDARGNVVFYSDRLDGSSITVPASTIDLIAQELKKDSGKTCTVRVPFTVDRCGIMKLMPGPNQGTVNVTLTRVKRAA